MLTFGAAVRAFYGRYFDFQGRSQRSEFWWVQLYVYVCYAIFLILMITGSGGIEALVDAYEGGETGQIGPAGYIGIIGLIIFGLVNIIPSIAISVRRFHDLGYTGWLVLAFGIGSVIPYIGSLISIGNLVWFAMKGTHGPNKYGSDPLTARVEA